MKSKTMRCRLKTFPEQSFYYGGIHDLFGLEQFITPGKEKEKTLFRPVRIHSIIKNGQLNVVLNYHEDQFNRLDVVIPPGSIVCLDSDGLFLDLLYSDKSNDCEYECIKYTHQSSDNGIDTMLWLEERYNDLIIERNYYPIQNNYTFYVGIECNDLPEDQDLFFIKANYGLRVIDSETFNKNYELIEES